TPIKPDRFIALRRAARRNELDAISRTEPASVPGSTCASGSAGIRASEFIGGVQSAGRERSNRPPPAGTRDLLGSTRLCLGRERRAEATCAEYHRQKASGSGGHGVRLPLW